MAKKSKTTRIPEELELTCNKLMNKNPGMTFADAARTTAKLAEEQMHRSYNKKIRFKEYREIKL